MHTTEGGSWQGRGSGGAQGFATAAVGCCVGCGTAGSGLDGNGIQGSATDGLRTRAIRARQLVRRQGTARAWRGLKLKAKDGLWRECD